MSRRVAKGVFFGAWYHRPTTPFAKPHGVPHNFRLKKALALACRKNFLTDAPETGILPGTKILIVDRNNRPHLLTLPRSMRVAGFVFGGAVSGERLAG